MSAVAGLRRARSPQLLSLLHSGHNGASSAFLRSLMQCTDTAWSRVLREVRRMPACLCSQCRSQGVLSVGCVRPLVWPVGACLPTPEGMQAWPELRLEGPRTASVMRHLRRRPRTVRELMRLVPPADPGVFPGSATHKYGIATSVSGLRRRGLVAPGRLIWLGSTSVAT